MQHPGTDTGPSCHYWGEKEQTVSTLVPLMTRTAMFHNSEILAFEATPSHVPKLMAMVACHLPRLARSPDLALALIAATPSLKSV